MFSEILHRIVFSVTGHLSVVNDLQCRPLIGCRENAQNLLIGMLSVWFYKTTGGFLYVNIAALGPLKKFTESVLKLVSNLKRASWNFNLDFLSATRQHKIVKTISAYTESTNLIVKAFKKYSSRDTIPLQVVSSYFYERTTSGPGSSGHYCQNARL